jgi:abortive infection bacteriophage resistance protein
MSDDKNFLTYNQQLKKLRNDKKISCNSSSKDKEILVRMGYFNIVNGYKYPFICDKDANGNHIYLPDTDLMNIYELKKFDEKLRNFLLRYITQIEEEVRTLTGYKFDQCNENGKIPWYDAKAYSEDARLQNKISAISSAYSELSKSQLDYVRFYMDKHTSIPTWIMIKVINFSTFIDVLNNSKQIVKHSVCELYGMIDESGYPNVKLLIGSLHWLRKVRNSCAHNERIYCITETSNGNKKGRIKEKYFKQLRKSYSRDTEKKLIDLLVYFKYYLPASEYKSMMKELMNMMLSLEKAVSRNAFDNIRGQMGIKDMRDLQILIELQKDKINYNTFDKKI